MRQAHLEISFRLTVVNLAFSNLSIVSIEHEDLFWVFIKYVDRLRHRRVEMWDVLCFRYICHDLLLYALLWHFMVLTNLSTFLNVLENCLILFYLFASRAREEQHVKNLLNITVKFLWSLFASTSVDGALPSQLQFNATITEKHVTLWAFLRIRFCDKFAELANELVKCTRHPWRFVYIHRWCLKHFH